MMMFLKNPATLLAVFFAVTTTVQARCEPCFDDMVFNNVPTDRTLQIPNHEHFPPSIRGKSVSCALIAPALALIDAVDDEELFCSALALVPGFQNKCCVDPSDENDTWGRLYDFFLRDVIGGVLDDFCFSDRMEVQVEGGAGTTTKRMDQLKIGDKVLTTEGSYAKVYSFAHMERNAKTEFLQIHSSTIEAPLEITPSHMLYVSKTAHAPATVVPAGAVQVGDYLRAAATAEPAPVTAIRTVVRQGAYAPLTESGTIVVQGVVASNYVALPKVFQEHLSFGVQHKMEHVAMSPYRLHCSMKAGGCEDEMYNEKTGYSNAVMMLLPLLAWSEWMLLHGSSKNMATLVAAVLGYYVWKKKAASADKSIVIKK